MSTCPRECEYEIKSECTSLCVLNPRPLCVGAPPKKCVPWWMPSCEGRGHCLWGETTHQRMGPTMTPCWGTVSRRAVDLERTLSVSTRKRSPHSGSQVCCNWWLVLLGRRGAVYVWHPTPVEEKVGFVVVGAPGYSNTPQPDVATHGG